MKRKVLISTIVLSLLFAGIASAASLWGTHKGNNIIMIAIDGKPVKTGDVPAISYNGRTMIPIYLLSQAGINYTWNQQTKTVDIEKQTQSESFSDGVKLSDLNNWAYVASYYSELDSIAALYSELLGSFNFSTSLILNNESSTAITGSLETLKDTLNNIKTDFSNLVKENEKPISDTFNYMGADSSKLNEVVDGYDEALTELFAAYNDLKEYYQSGKSTSLDDYFDLAESANNKIVKSRTIAKEQFKFWINGIINQKQ